MEPSSGSPGRAGGVRKTYYLRKKILTIYNDDKNDDGGDEDLTEVLVTLDHHTI